MTTATGRTCDPEPAAAGGLLGRVSRLEWTVAVLAAAALMVLVLVEPDILEAPFENARTLVFTFVGTVAAAVALVLMLRHRVHPVLRVLVLVVPFVAVSWWLLSPFFVDDVVDDDFATSIADATPAPDTDPDPGAPAPTPSTATWAAREATLRGAGRFVGLAGHDGKGDAGIFLMEDGAHVLRLENFDIQNGPDLRLYLVPGAGRTDPSDDSLYLGELRGNVGDQTYELPADFALPAGDWTVLVWCEAFRVEFVAAAVTLV